MEELTQGFGCQTESGVPDGQNVIAYSFPD